MVEKVSLESLGLKNSQYGNLTSLNQNSQDLLSVFGRNMNPRHLKAFMGQSQINLNCYETGDILHCDLNTLMPMAETLHENRCWITGRKIFGRDRVLKLLNNDSPSGAHKSLALYKLYCAKYGGLKDKNGSIDFHNLKDPGLLIKQSKDFWTLHAAGTHNKTIDKLTDIAVNAYSPELAVVLIRESGNGVNINDKIVKKLLLDSNKNMDENAYNKFITEIDTAYKELTGKSLDKFIKEEYSKDPFGLGWFGANKQGNEYLSILDNARQNTHGMNNNIFSLGFGMMGINAY